MSRCFPFPPPGYERKARPDDANPLIKEEQKEKKHKKDKKDKDKKEQKERKEKEKGEDKHKDKERKHKKHKDKKKDKDKHKSTQESQIVGPSELQNGKELGTVCNDDSQNNQILVELGKRTGNDVGATDNGMAQRPRAEQRSMLFPEKFVDGGGSTLAGANGKIMHERGQIRMANGQNPKVNASSLENGFAQNFSGENQNKIGPAACPTDKVEKQKEGGEKKKRKKHENKEDGERKGRDKKSKSKEQKEEKKKEKDKEKEKKVKEGRQEQIKHRDSDSYSVDIHNSNQSSFLKESNSREGNLRKRKEPESNGFSHMKQVQPSKLPKPVSSSHQVMQNGHRFDPLQNTINMSSDRDGIFRNQKDCKVIPKVVSSQSVPEKGQKPELGQTANASEAQLQGSINRHKAEEGLASSPRVGIGQKTDSRTAINRGLMQQGMVGNNEVTKKVSSVHQVLANGRKIEPSRLINQGKVSDGLISNHMVNEKVSPLHLFAGNGRKKELSLHNIHKAEERQGSVINHKMDGKESQINGIPDNLKCASTMPPSTSPKIKDKAEKHVKKPPHPDLKYLSQILTVPEVELPQLDDQDWLFSSDDSRAKNPRFMSSEVEETKPVWAEAMLLESIDVIALPYVIPY